MLLEQARLRYNRKLFPFVYMCSVLPCCYMHPPRVRTGHVRNCCQPPPPPPPPPQPPPSFAPPMCTAGPHQTFAKPRFAPPLRTSEFHRRPATNVRNAVVRTAASHRIRRQRRTGAFSAAAGSHRRFAPDVRKTPRCHSFLKLTRASSPRRPGSGCSAGQHWAPPPLRKQHHALPSVLASDQGFDELNKLRHNVF